MTAIAFAPQHNTGTKKDATGAFQPEMVRWITHIKDQGDTNWINHVINNRLSAAEMRADVIKHISEFKPDRIAFFCHGWKTGIQFGFGMKHVKELAKTIIEADQIGADLAAISGGRMHAPIITLFCCLTADGPIDGDGGFADRLRDELCIAGAVNCRVDAHTTAGHTTRNPNVRRFDGLGSPVGGMGGQHIVAPGSALWARWVKALKTGDLRFRFSAMEVAEIHEELVGGAA